MSLREEIKEARRSRLIEQGNPQEQKLERFRRKVFVACARDDFVRIPLSKDENTASSQFRLLEREGLVLTKQDLTQRVNFFEKMLGIVEKDCVKDINNIHSEHMYFPDGDKYRTNYGCRTWIVIDSKNLE